MIYLAGFFLFFILFLLVIVFFVFKNSKKEAAALNFEPRKDATLESLIEKLKTETKDAKKIDDLVQRMIDDFPFPQKEKDAKQHLKFVYFYAKNPLTTAKMIVEMQKALTWANPKYAKQIETYQMSGVESRKKSFT